MCREINYLVAEFDVYFPLEGNLSVFGRNCSTAEMSPVLSKLIIFTHVVKGPYQVGICAYCGERNAVKDLCNIGKSSSTLINQKSKQDEKFEDIKSMVSVNMTMYPVICLDEDHMNMFGGFCDLYMTSVRSIWCVKAAPAHIWPDLAGGVFLRTGQVSSNTDAATWTSYLLQSENGVAFLVASPFSSNALGKLGHTFAH